MPPPTLHDTILAENPALSRRSGILVKPGNGARVGCRMYVGMQPSPLRSAATARGATSPRLYRLPPFRAWQGGKTG